MDLVRACVVAAAVVGGCDSYGEKEAWGFATRRAAVRESATETRKVGGQMNNVLAKPMERGIQESRASQPCQV